MADEPISALTLFTSYSTADEVEILDVSDTTFASTGTNKRIPFSTLLTMAGVGTTAGVATVAGGGTGRTAVGSADQLLGVAHTGGALEYKTLTAGSNITITPAAGSITIASTASGGGTVTSVGLAAPPWLSVTGSPVTNSGTLALAAATGQAQNQFLATPNGSSGAVGLRAIASADLPTSPTFTGNVTLSPTTSSSSGVVMKGSNSFIHDYIAPGTYGDNVFVGIGAGNFTMAMASVNYEASFNTALGYQALASLTSGYDNVAVGYLALTACTSGYMATAVGLRALWKLTSGHDIVAVGEDCMNENTTGYYNAGVGTDCMFWNTTGFQNTGIGDGALSYQTTGSCNVAVGFSTLNGVEAAGVGTSVFSHNTAVGNEAMFLALTGSSNTAVGDSSMYSMTTAHENSAVGLNSLYYITTGAYNVAVGNQSVMNLTTGAYNVGIGYQSLLGGSGATGGNNVGIGYYALGGTTTGSECTAVGHEAGMATKNGWNSLYLGSHAGQFETGSNVILIDTLNRTNQAGGRSGAPIYATTNSTPSSQQITFNVGTATVTGTTITSALKIGSNSILFGTAAPTSGTWVTGDVCYNSAPASGSPQGWACNSGGTPGTWKPMANQP